jgi:hypothetical protein
MHMVKSNHVYADELTAHGEHDVKTGMQQAALTGKERGLERPRP